MTDTTRERWVLHHDGHLLEVEGPPSRTTRRLRLFVDGEQVAEKKVTGRKTAKITHEETAVRAGWDRLGHLAVVALLPGNGTGAVRPDPADLKNLEDLKNLVSGGEEIWFTPPPGSRAERRERLARRHPRLFAARHVAVAVAKVLLPLLGIAVLIQIPAPDVDLPEPSLPDIDAPDLPRIPWPDLDLSWLPDIALPGWARAILQTAKYWVPILGAVLLALQEYERRKKQRDKAAQQTAANATAAGDPAWVTVTGWQGRGLHVQPLINQGPGVYRTSAPMPLHGDWKTLIRIHDGRTLAGVPLYMPADPAIGAGRLDAPPRFTRNAQSEKRILQRELKSDVPGWLWLACSSVVLLCTLALILALGWGVDRIARELRAEPAAPAAGPRERVGT